MSFNIDGNGIQTGNSLYYTASLTDSTYNLPIIPIGTAAVFYGSAGLTDPGTTVKTPTTGTYAIIRCTAASGTRGEGYKPKFETQNCTHFFPAPLSANTTITSVYRGSRSSGYIVVFYWRVS